MLDINVCCTIVHHEKLSLWVKNKYVMVFGYNDCNHYFIVIDHKVIDIWIVINHNGGNKCVNCKLIATMEIYVWILIDCNDINNYVNFNRL